MLKRILANYKHLSLILLLLIIIAGLFMLRSDAQNEQDAISEDIPSVSLLNLEDLPKNSFSISASGEVQSLNQVELKSQVSAVIRAVHIRLGSIVFPGQALVSFDNADGAAQLAQAQAGVQSAQASLLQMYALLEAEKAGLAELERGARLEEIAIKQSQLASSQQTLNNLYNSIPTILNDSFAKAQDSVRVKTNGLFTTLSSNSYTLSFVGCTPQAESDAPWFRFLSEIALDKWELELQGLDSTDSEALVSALAQAKLHLGTIQNLLDTTNTAIISSCMIANTSFDTHRANIALARSSINGELTALEASEQAITSQIIMVSRVQSELNLLLAGATQEQLTAKRAQVNRAQASVLSAQAQVASAQASVRAVQAQLAKTVIRSPIAGTIAVIPAKLGQLITPGQLVVSIVNTQGLQVKVYINSDDLAYIDLGSPATINEVVNGTVTNVAPSIDPATKKVEVIIALDDGSRFVIGQFVDVAIKRNGTTKESLFLPLETVKVTQDGGYILAVNSNNVLEAHLVELGEVSGEFVQIVSDISGIPNIIASVRAFEEGQRVEF